MYLEHEVYNEAPSVIDGNLLQNMWSICKALLSPACLSRQKKISNSRPRNKYSHSNISCPIFSISLAGRAS